MVYCDFARLANTRRRCPVWLLSLLAVGVASAQIYPPVGYPPTGYPGGYPYPGRTGPGIPVPGRGSKPKGDTTKGQPLPNFRGTLKHMDSKIITLALDDNRILDFKRTDKTKFFKNGDEIKDPKFAEGDQLSVEGPEDSEGYMTAVNVYWEKAAAATATAKSDDKDGEVHDTWKDAPKDTGKDASAAAGSPAPPTERATEDTPPPAKAASDDPGRPVLRRGKPADTSREHSEPVPAQDQAAPPQSAPQQSPSQQSPPQQVAANLPPPGVAAPPTITRGDDDAPPPSIPRTGDDLIRKASDAALDFTETLPSYFCQEMISRYQSESAHANWQSLDIVGAVVVYENGKENYRDLTLNGKPAKGKTFQDLGGSWSTGEFGTVLIDLFSPATAADFTYKHDSRINGITAKLYDFNVLRQNSHWVVHMGSQTYSPAYKGSVWIDPRTSRVLRIEMQAYGFPDEFPTDHVESATDYDYVRLGDAKQYLLPVHAETLSCQRGSSLCARNAIDFRNYHKYEGESSIKFGDVKQ